MIRPASRRTCGYSPSVWGAGLGAGLPCCAWVSEVGEAYGRLMHISIVLSTYRRLASLRQTLESFWSLATDGLDWEVLVVDNAGEHAVHDLVHTASQQLPVRYFVETTPGKNSALNRVLPECRGALYLFTDDDILADQRWLIEAWQGAQRWPHSAVFGGRVLPQWPAGEPPIPVHDPFARGAYVIADWGLPEAPYAAECVFDPNMAVRAAVFHAGWPLILTLVRMATTMPWAVKQTLPCA